MISPANMTGSLAHESSSSMHATDGPSPLDAVSIKASSLDDPLIAKPIENGKNTTPRSELDSWHSEETPAGVASPPGNIPPTHGKGLAPAPTPKAGIDDTPFSDLSNGEATGGAIFRTDSAFTIGSVGPNEGEGKDFLADGITRRPSHLASNSFDAKSVEGKVRNETDTDKNDGAVSRRNSMREVMQLRSFSEDMLSSNLGDVTDKESAAMISEVKLELSRSRSATAPSMKNLMVAEEAIMKPDKGSPADLALTALQPDKKKDGMPLVLPEGKKHRRNSSTDKVK